MGGRKDDGPAEYLQHMIPEVVSTTEDWKIIKIPLLYHWYKICLPIIRISHQNKRKDISLD